MFAQVYAQNPAGLRLSNEMGNNETACRIRAARNYAGLEQAQLATTTNIGIATIRRMEYGQRTANTDELIAIANACSLPLAFFKVDFSRLPELLDAEPVSYLPADQDPDLRKQVDELQRVVDTIAPSLAALLRVAQQPPLAQPRKSSNIDRSQEYPTKAQKRG